jgi:hypothetical protein
LTQPSDGLRGERRALQLRAQSGVPACCAGTPRPSDLCVHIAIRDER